MEHFISMYIDNELSLEEKVIFVDQIYGNKKYRDDAVTLIEQEKLLNAALVHQAPNIKAPSIAPSRPLRLFGLAVAACLLLACSFLIGTNFTQRPEPSLQHASAVGCPSLPYRFVLFQQGSKQVEITGSFTNWQKVSLTPVGLGGYWEITLEVPSGEHRYAYIIDGTHFLPDPTVAAQEADDFGAMNSILNIGS